MFRWLTSRPWIWFALFFLSFIGLWVWFIGFAYRNAPPPFDKNNPPVPHRSPP